MKCVRIAALLAAIGYSGFAATAGLDACMQSFSGFQGSCTAILPLTGERASCASLESLRASFTPTDAERRAVDDITGRITRLRAAIQESDLQLRQDVLGLAKGTAVLNVRTTQAAYAVAKALSAAVSAPSTGPAGWVNVVRQTAKAERAVGKVIDAIYDDIQTGTIAFNSTTTLKQVLEARLAKALAEARGADGATDRITSFVMLCDVVASQCIGEVGRRTDGRNECISDVGLRPDFLP